MRTLRIYEIFHSDQLKRIDGMIPVMVLEIVQSLTTDSKHETAFLTKIPMSPSCSLLVPLLEPCNLSDLDISRNWLVIDAQSYILTFELRKLAMRSPNLLILEPNHILNVLLLKPTAVASKIDITPYTKVIGKLFKYHQFLIRPLNPLLTDLDMDIYSIFENDLVKYDLYQDAISLAFLDLHNPNVLIIGPGKGGILTRALKKTSNITVIEKNPKVIPHLKTSFPNVTLIHDDARAFVHDNFDLIISEMMGSFGCNEMFPEVLLHTKSTIMIPTAISTLIALINTNNESTTPYLRNLKHFYYLTPFSQLWEYNYPNTDETNSLNQHSIIQFTAQISGTITAIKGIFIANLYGPYNITCLHELALPEDSNVFGTYCNSWFPIIFPIKPLDVEEGDLIKVEFWRTSNQTVTYEWQVTAHDYQYKSLVTY